jgi:hypothetical protein
MVRHEDKRPLLSSSREVVEAGADEHLRDELLAWARVS